MMKIKRTKPMSFKEFMTRTDGNDEFWYLDGMTKKEYEDIPMSKKVVLATAILAGEV